ncbi:MAG: hypothetical protein RR620_11950 [Clostridium sp.]
MGRTVELRKTVKEELSRVCDGVYYLKAPSDALYPYITYELKSTNIDGFKVYQLEVYINSNLEDTSILEDLGDLLEREFNETMVTTIDHILSFSINVRNTPMESDKNIMKLRMLIDISYYERRT